MNSTETPPTYQSNITNITKYSAYMVVKNLEYNRITMFYRLLFTLLCCDWNEKTPFLCKTVFILENMCPDFYKARLVILV